jgi:hypothetical protein
MDTENKQTNKTRGRPQKYHTEEEKKEANKIYMKTYWNNKKPDDEVVVRHKERIKSWYHEKMKDPEYVQKERERKLKYNKKKREELVELKQKLLLLEK